MGTLHYPLSRQIADTARVHGLDWTREHFMNKRGLSAFEWQILSTQARREVQA